MPFAPTDIANLLLWLKADAIGGLSDGDAVSTWADSSGNGYDATQSGGNRPVYKTGIINGLPVVRFASASSQWMDTVDIAGADGAALTVVVVFKAAALATNMALLAKWDYNTQGSWGFQTDSSASDEMRFYTAEAINSAGGNYKYSTDANLTASAFAALTAIYDGSQGTAADRVKLYRDGTLLASTMVGTVPTTLAAASSTLKIGKFGGALTRYANVDIAEALVYAGVVAGADLTNLWSYLSGRFGSITLSPVSAHLRIRGGVSTLSAGALSLATVAARLRARGGVANVAPGAMGLATVAARLRAFGGVAGVTAGSLSVPTLAARLRLRGGVAGVTPGAVAVSTTAAHLRLTAPSATVAPGSLSLPTTAARLRARAGAAVVALGTCALSAVSARLRLRGGVARAVRDYPFLTFTDVALHPAGITDESLHTASLADQALNPAGITDETLHPL